MNRPRIVGLAGTAALALGLAPTALSQPGTPWLHVRAEEPGKKSSVAVNLPLSLVEVALKASRHEIASGGRVRIGRRHHGLEVSDLRQMWRELKAAGDAELVRVEDGDETVRVARSGDLVLVHVDREGKASVRVELPADVVDALLSGEGDDLDVRAALERLRSRRGDIVKVSEKDHIVRVWIDEAK